MVTETAIWEAIRTVEDPEYPISIVDMGMIYDVSVDGGRADIAMTFTSIGCPAIDMLLDDVRMAALSVDGVDEVHVDIVWSPPWTSERITDHGRRVLALHGVVN